MDWLNWEGLGLERNSPNTPHQLTKAKVSHTEFGHQEGIIMGAIHLLQVCYTIDLILLLFVLFLRSVVYIYIQKSFYLKRMLFV